MIKNGTLDGEDYSALNHKYIGNAKIIESLEALPKIGERHKYNNDIVVSVELQNEKADGYVIYKVKYLMDGEFIDTDIDIYYFEYAIKPENIK